MGVSTRATGRTARDTDLALRVEDAGSTEGSGPRASRAGGHVDEDLVELMVFLVLFLLMKMWPCCWWCCWCWPSEPGLIGPKGSSLSSSNVRSNLLWIRTANSANIAHLLIFTRHPTKLRVNSTLVKSHSITLAFLIFEKKTKVQVQLSSSDLLWWQ